MKLKTTTTHNRLADPRRAQSRCHPLSAMLTLIALRLLMGGLDMKNIWRRVAKLNQRQRETIGLTVRSKESGRLTMPSYDALNDLMNPLDPKAYAAALTQWLQANQGILPRSLALDGKSIGDGKCGMIVTLCRHEDGRPVAMIPANGKKENSEVSEARALLCTKEVRLGKAVREHWSIENKNHHKRDHHVWQEDRHRHRRANIAQNLALARNALLATIPFDEKTNLPSLIVNYQDNKQLAINLILKSHPSPSSSSQSP